MEPMPTDAQWSALTALPAKRDEFGRDLYFRATWLDLLDVVGPGAVAELQRVALLSFKCEAVVGRRMQEIVEFVERHGFHLVHIALTRHTRHSMREVWRYNWHVYTRDRLRLMSVLHTANDIAVLILWDDEYDGRIAGSVRLASLKGSADGSTRDPSTLRTALRPPSPGLNFVHVADEPADIVREIGIFLGSDERWRALEDTMSNGPAGHRTDAAATLQDLERRYPAHDLDSSLALKRIEEAGVVDQAAIERLRSSLGPDGERLSWGELRSYISPSTGLVDEWDFITIAAEALSGARAGVAEPLPGVSPEAWLAHRASGSNDAGPGDQVSAASDPTSGAVEG